MWIIASKQTVSGAKCSVSPRRRGDVNKGRRNYNNMKNMLKIRGYIYVNTVPILSG